MIQTETKHHMGRRCHGWDYGQRAIYMITVNLAERGKPVLAGWPEPRPGALDHFHGILFVQERLPAGKTLGNVVGSFKSRSTSLCLAMLGRVRPGPRASPCTAKFWADGFVDTILFREGQLESMVVYIRENPDRLAEKRANPDLFRRIANLSLPICGGNGFTLSYAMPKNNIRIE